MRKLFLLIAFTGIVGAASATTLVSTKAKLSTVIGDDKKGDDKKKKDEKACCKKDATGKHTADASGKACSGEAKTSCTAGGEKKSCCKSKATAATTTTEKTQTEK